jgi:glutaredoxin 3
VTFTEKNVRADPEALQELLALGSRSTPTTTIDDELIIGFDRARISVLLGLQ